MRRSLLLALLALLVVPSAPAAADDPTYEQVVDLTFPTDPRARFQEDYHDPRSGGRVHRATDLMGDKGWPIHAAVGGTVTFITGLDGPPPSYGYMISIAGDDGREYSYVHLNNDTPGTDDGNGGPEHAYAPGIAKGTRVERGQFIAYLGDSGNAEDAGAHLHFEIEDPDVVDPYGSNRIDPYNSLVAALERGDVPTMQASAVARVAGTDRVATAIELSKAAFPSASVAVLAPSGTPAEAIVAGPLAAALGGPVLLTPSSHVDDRVEAELDRLGASRVVAVGLDLDVPGRATERIAGDDAFAIAATVADAVRELTGTSKALIALGAHADPNRAWPDSLVASYLGSVDPAPVLLVTGGELPAVTAAAVDDFDRAVIVGGEAAVGRSVADAIGARGVTVTRLAGATRYGTATAVAGSALATGRVSASEVWAATGRNWPDAVAAGPAVARAGHVLVLVDGAAAGADGELDPWLDRHDVAEACVIGGPVAVSDAAARSLATRIGS